ncbi:MAG TPA: hypothetical protein VMJ65_24920 [Solirubrobacteraceae bacterium]|nr:hypothetical protein [Solirubrobacteraceae bacterium]
MSGFLQLAGALAVLSAFVAVQSGRAAPSSRITLATNLAGSSLLAVLALTGRQWGFLLLEGAWAAVSAAGLARRLIPMPSPGLGDGNGQARN